MRREARGAAVPTRTAHPTNVVAHQATEPRIPATDPGAGWPVLAYVAVVETMAGGERRRVYLTLASAHRALDRAAGRGVGARLVLAELRAVGGAA